MRATMTFSSCCLLLLLLGPQIALAADTTAAGKLVIAHRGASGYLPEHTLEAYALAYAQGADLIEPDVVLSRDDVLVCNHDIHMGATTDVAEKFPDRRREDGRYYFIDFTLAELKTLNIKGRRDAPEPGYQIPTLAEMLTMVRRLNERTGRNVGTIPEPKSPAWHREAGHPIEEKLLADYAAFGYSRRADPVVVQCFELDSLRRMRRELKSDLKLVFLTGAALDDKLLDELATFADGIGPALKLVADGAEEKGKSPLVERAHQRGLQVYPYTLDKDEAQTRRFFAEFGVDGLFSDYPDVAVRARDRQQ